MFTLEGYQPENNTWVQMPKMWIDAATKDVMVGKIEFDTEDEATKCAWRNRVLAQVPVRLLYDGQVLWSDREKPMTEEEFDECLRKATRNPSESI